MPRRPQFSTVRADFIALANRVFDGIAPDLAYTASFAPEPETSPRIHKSDAASQISNQLSSQYPEYAKLHWKDQQILLSEWEDTQREYIYL